MKTRSEYAGGGGGGGGGGYRENNWGGRVSWVGKGPAMPVKEKSLHTTQQQSGYCQRWQPQDLCCRAHE
jgi:hypothetical protein